MGKFAIGDRVKVTTKRFGGHQHGLVGEVLEVNRAGPLPLSVDFPGKAIRYSYAETDLVLLDDLPILPEPEFDLDEIERAERLVHGVR